MGQFKHGQGKGRKGQGFQQPPPKVPAAPAPPKASSRESEKPKESYSNLSLYSQYLSLPPPRSLQQLALKHGLATAPIEWYQLADDEQWAVHAQTVDDSRGEARVGSNWQAAQITQDNTLEITDGIISEVKRQLRSVDSVADLKDLAATLKNTVGLRLQVLEGLERPESNSAAETPKAIAPAPPMDARAINMLMFGHPLDAYEQRKLAED